MYSTIIRQQYLFLANRTSLSNIRTIFPNQSLQKFECRGFSCFPPRQLESTIRLLKSSRKYKRIHAKASIGQHIHVCKYLRSLSEEREKVDRFHQRHRQAKIDEKVDKLDLDHLPFPEELKRDIRKTLKENPEQKEIEIKVTFFSSRFIRRVLASVLLIGTLFSYITFSVITRVRSADEFWEVINSSFERDKN